MSRPNAAAGFTLVELLLIGAVLAALLGGGGAALVRQQRESSSEQLRDTAEQRHSRQLLQQEIALAERLSATAADLPPACAGLGNPLVLHGPAGAWRIAYALQSQGPEAGWRGPARSAAPLPCARCCSTGWPPRAASASRSAPAAWRSPSSPTAAAEPCPPARSMPAWPAPPAPPPIASRAAAALRGNRHHQPLAPQRRRDRR